MENINPEVIKEGVSKKTLQTISGMAVANFMVCQSISTALDYNPKWFSLLTAALISLGACLFVDGKKTLGAVFLALLAAFQVFLMTSGINTVLAKTTNNDVAKSGSTQPKQSSLIDLPQLLQTKSWWFDEIIEAKEKETEMVRESAFESAEQSSQKFADINQKAEEISQNPQKAAQIAVQIKDITNDAQNNLQKETVKFNSEPPSSTFKQDTAGTRSSTNPTPPKSPDSPQSATPKISQENVRKARQFEAEAFALILKKDFVKAAESFALAEKEYPGLHNCYELSRYLKANANQDVKEIYRTVLTKWSWGMPTDVKTAMRKLLEQTEN